MRTIMFIEIIADVALCIILMLLIIEVFVFQKALQKQGISFEINLGNIISKKQLIDILDLLESENKDYKVKGRRIIIYGYKSQYIFPYLVRLFLAHIFKQEELINKYKKVMTRDSQGALPCGGYIDKYDIIEIYEFNLKRIGRTENIDILKAQLVNSIAHEFRHRAQYINQIDVVDEEADAEEFAKYFCNKNKQKLKEILNLLHTITFKNINSNL